MLVENQEGDIMEKKNKDARIVFRVNSELSEWLDEYAKHRGTDKSKILTDFVEMLWKIEHGRSGKGERLQAS